MAGPEVKNISKTAEVRKFNLGKIELVSIGGGTVARFELQKGWKWSNDVKPVVKTSGVRLPTFNTY